MLSNGMLAAGLWVAAVTVALVALMGVAMGSGSGGSGGSGERERGEGAGVRYSPSRHDITRLTAERIEELAAGLTDEERRIILKAGTEPAFCGNLLDNKLTGTYLCRLCALPLFRTEQKFDSGTGWPSFSAPYDPAHIAEYRDDSHGMVRTEICCARCDGHLGHVFPDGPRTPPHSTGLRYCLNSASLTFVEKGEELPPAARPVATHTAYFAGGCFWGIEHRFESMEGVLDVVSGYMGGQTKDPTYREVCSGTTGHAETVRITFDPARVSYGRLLDVFFRLHDPTSLNRQGPDIGTQYRSAVFPEDEAQLRETRAFIEEAGSRPRFRGKRIVTEVRPASEAGPFYEAEAFHQDYHARNGGTCWLPEIED